MVDPPNIRACSAAQRAAAPAEDEHLPSSAAQTRSNQLHPHAVNDEACRTDARDSNITVAASLLGRHQQRSARAFAAAPRRGRRVERASLLLAVVLVSLLAALLAPPVGARIVVEDDVLVAPGATRNTAPHIRPIDVARGPAGAFLDDAQDTTRYALDLDQATVVTDSGDVGASLGDVDNDWTPNFAALRGLLEAGSLDDTQLRRLILALRDQEYDDVKITERPSPRVEPTATTGRYLGKRAETANATTSSSAPACSSTSEGISTGQKTAYAIVVVVLVLLSGVFAGLTLGYMSLDETQLQVLATTGTPTQQQYARKIIPIRKDGHLLLTTLILCNMLSNEALPVVFDPLVPSAVISIVASTALVVIFAELIPQSVCTRYGLAIGAYMAIPMRILIIVAWPIAWPVSRILHWVLGPHQGIIYRRAELKELVTMHAAEGGKGGDLKGDTVMIVGGALDLQTKTVRDAMTPIDKVFMLPSTAKLDYDTLGRIVRSGHSRIPIYQEIEVPLNPADARSGNATPTRRTTSLLNPFARRDSARGGNFDAVAPAVVSEKSGGAAPGTPGPLVRDQPPQTIVRKKILGTLLVKSCVLLDPEDAVPVSEMALCALPTVPGDEPLLNILNAFQEGRSHMAIVSSRPRRVLQESVADMGSKSNLFSSAQPQPPAGAALGDIAEEKTGEAKRQGSRSSSPSHSDASSPTRNGSDGSETKGDVEDKEAQQPSKKKRTVWDRLKRSHVRADQPEATVSGLATDVTLADSGAPMPPAPGDEPGTQYFGPLGIITLEDVLEELIGEEILDEYDDRGDDQDFRNFQPPPSPDHALRESEAAADPKRPAATAQAPAEVVPSGLGAEQQPRKTVLSRLGLTRQRSARSIRGGWDSGDGAGVPLAVSPMAMEEKSAGGKTMVQVTQEPEDYLSARQLPPQQQRSGTFTDMSASGELPPREPMVGQPSRRANSVPPSRRHSTTSIDGGAAAGGEGQVATGVKPLLPHAAPTTNRPVVIRTQPQAGGPVVTTIVGENMLRGRPLLRSTTTAADASHAGGGGAGPGGSAGAAEGVASPSLGPSAPAAPHGGASGAVLGGGPSSPLPAGVSTPTFASPLSRGNRFKSQPVAAAASASSSSGAGGALSGGAAMPPLRSPSGTRALSQQQQQAVPGATPTTRVASGAGGGAEASVETTATSAPSLASAPQDTAVQDETGRASQAQVGPDAKQDVVATDGAAAKAEQDRER